jgi:hypothetical protein
MNDPIMLACMKKLASLPTFTHVDGNLAETLQSGAPGLEPQTHFVSGEFPLLARHIRIGKQDLFWLANNSDQTQSAVVQFSKAQGAVSLWNCESGTIKEVPSKAEGTDSQVGLVFKPLEGYWVVFNPDQAVHPGPLWKYNPPQELMVLGGEWSVRYDPAIQPPVQFPAPPPDEFKTGVSKGLESWQKWGIEKFSGLLDYSCKFEMTRTSDKVTLDLGKVCYVAEVFLNGESVGSRLWGPYQFDLSSRLKQGKNQLTIRIANLINNSYGQNIESGLLGPVRLVSEQGENK